MQTTASHIFAVGDINGEGAFTHTAVNDGEIFWDYCCGDAGPGPCLSASPPTRRSSIRRWAGWA
ncbi:MAG: hypothetical protein V9H69_19290 [Anaerolineae bacterium]